MELSCRHTSCFHGPSRPVLVWAVLCECDPHSGRPARAAPPAPYCLPSFWLPPPSRSPFCTRLGGAGGSPSVEKGAVTQLALSDWPVWLPPKKPPETRRTPKQWDSPTRWAPPFGCLPDPQNLTSFCSSSMWDKSGLSLNPVYPADMENGLPLPPPPAWGAPLSSGSEPKGQHLPLWLCLSQLPFPHSYKLH